MDTTEKIGKLLISVDMNDISNVMHHFETGIFSNPGPSQIVKLEGFL